MSVIPLHRERDAAIRRHPASRYSGTRNALSLAVELYREHGLPEGSVTALGEGTALLIDYTRRRHAAGDVRIACQALGFVVAENAADLDGCAAVELRGQGEISGVEVVVIATVPVPAEWSP